jgi:DNA-binding HxlR family transcriptional regulator
VVHPFEIVAHPVRRRIVEVLATGDHSAGTLSEIAFTELGVTRTAVSHQLRTLREQGVVWSTVDPVEPRSRSYRLDPAFLASLDLAVASCSSCGNSDTAPRKVVRRPFRLPAKSGADTASVKQNGDAAVPRSPNGWVEPMPTPIPMSRRVRIPSCRPSACRRSAAHRLA